jgi:predicted adenylyl cyclase CyaB
MSHFEIEVKSLLGEKERADALKQKMQELDPSCACVSTNKQLNHYFEGGDIHVLYEKVGPLLNEEQMMKLKALAERGSSFSVRTRQRDEEVLLVVKAAIDEGTSENTVKRMEFEEGVAVSLEELDALVLEAGYRYQAKWSREREEYVYKGANVCLDYNAGYGYLAEVEKIVADETLADQVRAEIDELMLELELEELQQDRLARMFEYYNQNWPEYYGTTKVFIIE